jgi:hypothetical protein
MEVRLFARRAVADLPNLFSLLVFFAVTALIFRSVQFALVVTASLGFHELGHAAALAWYGLDWRISFGVVGAWTWSPLAERQRLSHLANSIIHLSGPFFSLLLALLALGIQAIWQPPDRHLVTLASFSAQVGFINLLPLGPLSDGGKIVRRMMVSLNGSKKTKTILLPVSISVLMLVLYGLVILPELHAPAARASQLTPFLLELLLVGVWMTGSLLIESRRAALLIPQTGESPPESRMTPGEVSYLILVIWDLLVVALVISAATPFWLAPEYLLGSLRNVMTLLILLHRIAL